MSTRLVIDKAGRVVIPKPLREELHLGPGVWVFRSGQPLPASLTNEVLQQIPEERDLANLAKGE